MDTLLGIAISGIPQRQDTGFHPGERHFSPFESARVGDPESFSGSAVRVKRVNIDGHHGMHKSDSGLDFVAKKK